MPQMRVNRLYYTASQVQKKLGITHGELYSYVRNGRLHSVTPPGKKLGVYPRAEVDQLAQELHIFFAIRDKTEIDFVRATEDDMPRIAEISRAIFEPNLAAEEDTVYIETRSAWLKKNPDTMHILKSENTMVGYASLAPLSEEKITQIINEEISTDEITPEDIEDFSNKKPVHLYIMAIGIDPKYNKYEKHAYGARLISHLITFLTLLGHEGIKIETITARSHKPDGTRLLRKMGFPEVISPIPSKRLFILNIEETGNPLFTKYKEAFREGQRPKPSKINNKRADEKQGKRRNKTL
ncbi:MAG: helix-turn-helix domain-containing protein [Ktedonobacteraceae bacterium]|nr:helix-turn-helix domain-containing protein [Ktedonobacteraceae bacterium]